MGSPVPGILQARILEWVAISFSNACKWKVKVKSLSRVRLLATPWTAAYQAPPSMGFSRQEYWSGVPLPFPQTRGRKHQPEMTLSFRTETREDEFLWGCLIIIIGEGNGNPLQCSCLERDGGAWWASVYGVAQCRTRLKWLSSSSSIIIMDFKQL